MERSDYWYLIIFPIDVFNATNIRYICLIAQNQKRKKHKCRSLTTSRIALSKEIQCMQSQLTIQHHSSSREMQTRCRRQSRFADTAPHPVSGTRQGRGGHPQRRVGQGSVSDSLGPEDKKTEAAEKSTTSAITVSKMRTQICYLMVDGFRWWFMIILKFKYLAN